MQGPLHDDIESVLIDAAQIQQRVKELGREISAAYATLDPVLIGILKGATLFISDLLRAIHVHVTVDFMAISSYGAGTQSSGVVRILKDLDHPVAGRHLVIVEDIIDTGLTLRYLLDNLRSRRPASVSVCVLLDKRERRLVDVPLDYVGFRIPDRFVVGYGLDYNEHYRNLPFIGILRPPKSLQPPKPLRDATTPAARVAAAGEEAASQAAAAGGATAAGRTAAPAREDGRRA